MHWWTYAVSVGYDQNNLPNRVWENVLIKCAAPFVRTFPISIVLRWNNKGGLPTSCMGSEWWEKGKGVHHVPGSGRNEECHFCPSMLPTEMIGLRNKGGRRNTNRPRYNRKPAATESGPFKLYWIQNTFLCCSSAQLSLALKGRVQVRSSSTTSTATNTLIWFTETIYTTQHT